MKKRLLSVISLFLLLFLLCSCGENMGFDTDGNKDEDYFTEEGKHTDDKDKKDEEEGLIEEVIPSTTHKNNIPSTTGNNSVPGESKKPSATTSGGGAETTLPSWNYAGEVELPEDNF